MFAEVPSKYVTYLEPYKYRDRETGSIIVLLLYSHTHEVEYYYIIRFIMFLSDTMVITI